MCDCPDAPERRQVKTKFLQFKPRRTSDYNNITVRIPKAEIMHAPIDRRISQDPSQFHGRRRTDRIGNNAEVSDIKGAINHLDHSIENLAQTMDKLTTQQHPELRQRSMELLRRMREFQAMVAKELGK